MRSVDFGVVPPLPSMEEWQHMPKSVRRELNLFAGQLYFNDLKDYEKLKAQSLCRADTHFHSIIDRHSKDGSGFLANTYWVYSEWSSYLGEGV